MSEPSTASLSPPTDMTEDDYKGLEELIEKSRKEMGAMSFRPELAIIVYGFGLLIIIFIGILRVLWGIKGRVEEVVDRTDATVQALGRIEQTMWEIRQR